MAEKISMLIVTVDLDCYKCYNKIRKILCKLQDQERIRTISFDDISKTITIVGPFDPQRLACKIRCKGGKVVKDVQIMEVGGGKPPPAPVNNGKQKQKKPHAADSPAPEMQPSPPAQPPSPPAQPPSPDREMSAVLPTFVEEKKPKATPAELEPPPMPKEKPMDLPMPVPLPRPAEKERQPVEYVIPTVEIPSWPAPPVGSCGCPCCAPCYQGYYEGCRCGCRGRVYGYAVAAQPLPAAWGCGYRGCRTFSDEDPTAACSIM